MSTPPRQYNFIYAKLVNADDDLVGLVAYGIYKQHKISFLSSFKDEFGREPTDEECRVFYLTSTTSDQLQKYTTQAAGLVSELVTSTTIEEIQTFQADMLNSYETKIEQAVKRNVPTNAKTITTGVITGVVASLVAALMMSISYFIGHTSDKTAMEKVKEMVETRIVPEDSLNNGIDKDSFKEKE